MTVPTPADWQTLAAIVAVIGGVGGIVLWLTRNALHGSFAPLRSHQGLEKRVESLEHRSNTVPGHGEFLALSLRVGAVETGVAVLQQSINGVAEGVKRIEHINDLLLKHQIGEGEV